MLDLLEFFPLRYPLLVPLLNTIGYYIKHKTRIPNEIIPFILFAVASAASVVVRQFMSGYSGWYYWFDIVFMYGIVNSLKLTLYAIGGYEAVRAIRFTGRREEVKNKMRRGFIRSVLAIVVATVLISLVTVLFGTSFFGVFSHLTDAWIGIIIYAVAFAVFGMIADHKEKITPAYIVMATSTLLSAMMFLMASITTNRILCFVGLALTAVLGITAGLLAFIPYAKARKEERDKVMNPLDETKYKKAWVKVRDKLIKLSPEKQKELLRGFLYFKLVGDSIYGNVDFDRPLIPVVNSDGSQIITTVTDAKTSGVSTESVKEAEGYINSVVEAETVVAGEEK